MSANRDKTQKIAFVYSNLYQLYRKGKDAAMNSTVPGADAAGFVRVSASTGTNVLKSEDVREGNPLGLRVREYNPAALIGKRFEKPSYLKSGAAPAVQAAELPKAPAQQPAPLEGLKQNLQALNDLQAKLRFMLQELEDLVKE